MASEEQEEERRFLAELKARSGRDLGEWLAAIAAQGLADRNQIIDWLRGQGFPFARASWLERIHSNGGRPVYADAAATTEGAARPQAVVAKRPARQPSPREIESLEKLVAAAKGYRPLYALLEAEIRGAVADVSVRAKESYISFAAPKEFAAVTLHAAEVRLGLDLGERAFDPPLQRAKLKGPGPAISHMVVLTDARQVNADLLSLVITAHLRVNS